MAVRIIQGDCRAMLAALPDGSVQTVVTSPPYFGLRDYGHDGQIGLEETPLHFVNKLVDAFREVRRVLRADGTLWLNLGDSYASQGGAKTTPHLGKHFADRARGQEVISRSKRLPRGEGRWGGGGAAGGDGLKPKDMIGIPWRVAFALQDDGWYLRQDIIWSKPNPMPESVTDRCTKAHEYIFLFSKSERYYFDAEAIAEQSVALNEHDATGHGYSAPGQSKHSGTRRDWINRKSATKQELNGKTSEQKNPAFRAIRFMRNKRSVWTVTTKAFAGAHFATFPPDLIDSCILAGSSAHGNCAKCGAPWERQTERLESGYDGSKYGERAIAASGGAVSGGTAKSTLGSSNGKLVGRRETRGWAPTCKCGTDQTVPAVVLDPFGGAGTTGMVADRLGRDAILIELNPAYVVMAENRLRMDGGMFTDVGST